jgi:hypothetical protein
VDLEYIGATIPRRGRIGLKNLMLGHARKRHRATLKPEPVSRSWYRLQFTNTKTKTYVIWQPNDSVHRTPLKEVATVRIVAVAYELDVLFHGNRVATRDLPASSWGNVRNCVGRTPLFTWLGQPGHGKAPNNAGTCTNGQCGPSPTRQSLQVYPRSIVPECTEWTSR